MQEFIRKPSVSAQKLGLEECANYVVEKMHKDGLPAELHEIPDGPPLVFGHLKSTNSKKTMFCYSHYDVQPPEPIEEWSHGGPWSGAPTSSASAFGGSTRSRPSGSSPPSLSRSA